MDSKQEALPKQSVEWGLMFTLNSYMPSSWYIVKSNNNMQNMYYRHTLVTSSVSQNHYQQKKIHALNLRSHTQRDLKFSSKIEQQYFS